MTGLIGVFFSNYGIMGVGYEGINQVLVGSLAIIMLLTLGILKMIATAFIIGSGGSGGIFAPSLYIGAMFGGALGLIFQFIAPGAIHLFFSGHGCPFRWCSPGAIQRHNNDS
jgi:CIC family chloride channel protein